MPGFSAITFDSDGILYIGGAGVVRSTQSTLSDIPPPPQPVPLSPVSGESGVSTNPGLRWSALWAESSHVQVSTSPSFDEIIVEEDDIRNTLFEASDLANNKTYYWRVSAANAGGTSSWSDISTFKTVIAPPTLVSPGKSIDGEPVFVTFTWTTADGADTYHLQVSEGNAGFPDIVFEDSTLTDTTHIVAPLNYSTNYHWRVRAKNTEGTSVWSAVWKFHTAVGTAVERPDDEVPVNHFLVQNYPNPFNPETTIAFDMPRSGNVVLKVYDLMGRDVATLVSDTLPAGRHEVLWNATGHASGVYVYRLQCEGYAAVRAMVVMR